MYDLESINKCNKFTNQVNNAMKVFEDLNEVFDLGLNVEKIEKSFNKAYVDFLEESHLDDFCLSATLTSKTKDLLGDWTLALSCLEYRLNEISYGLINNIEPATIEKQVQIKCELREFRAAGMRITEGKGVGLFDIPLNCESSVPNFNIGIEAIWYLVLNPTKVYDLDEQHIIVPGIGTRSCMGKLEYLTPIYMHSTYHPETEKKVVVIDSSWDGLPYGKPMYAW